MNRVFSAFLFFILFACTDKKEKALENSVAETIPTRQPAEKPLDSALVQWLSYYQADNPEFTKDKFRLTETSAITYSPSNVIMLNQKGFNEIYKPFLVVNPGKTAYLDFDSYHWIVAKDGTASFEADQQVALVDLKTKTAKQIAFFGPSFRIEEAYWAKDSTVVLLGNTYEKVPFMLHFNFAENTKQHFQYPDTLKFEKPYSEFRMQKLGIITE